MVHDLYWAIYACVHDVLGLVTCMDEISYTYGCSDSSGLWDVMICFVGGSVFTV